MKTVVLTERERQKVRGWMLELAKLAKKNENAPKGEAALPSKIAKKLRRKDPPMRGELKMGELP